MNVEIEHLNKKIRHAEELVARYRTQIKVVERAEATRAEELKAKGRSKRDIAIEMNLALGNIVVAARRATSIPYWEVDQIQAKLDEIDSLRNKLSDMILKEVTP